MECTHSKLYISIHIECTYSKLYRETKAVAMALSKIVLVMCTLLLDISESRELVVVSTYPDSGNFSYIELVCGYNNELYNVSQSGVIGATFQLNGTDINEEIDSVETVTDANSTVLFLLTQEKEGFFTCSRNGSLSINSIGLAGNSIVYDVTPQKLISTFTAQPSTNYSGKSKIHEVDLSDTNSSVSTVLVCDIQPGALRQRYTVEWKQIQHNDTSNIINNDTFNLTLSINSSVNGSQYQCEVTIDHDGEGVNLTYEGRIIIIVLNTSGMHNETLHCMSFTPLCIFFSYRGDSQMVFFKYSCNTIYYTNNTSDGVCV